MPHVFLNRINIHYETFGEGPPLLFIHGLGSSGRDWEFQVAEFSRSYRVVTFDLRGHGQSDKPEGPYSIEMFAADTLALLDALEIGQAHVVGLSLGGAVAFQLAIDAPHRVKTLTIVNSAPQWSVRSVKDRVAIWKRIVIIRWFGMRRLGEILSRRLFARPEQAPLRETFIARWAKNDRRAYLASFRALVGWSISEHLETIRCATLIMASDHDYSPLPQKEAFAAKIPDAQVVTIADARHALPAEKPREFNRSLREFLSRHA